MKTRRILICLLGGAISAGICLAGRQIVYGFPQLALDNIAYLVANRLLLGFTIGISGWKINHIFHGGLLGLLFSLSVSIGFLPTDVVGFALFTLAGIGYGIFIEWLATDVFKASKI